MTGSGRPAPLPAGPRLFRLCDVGGSGHVDLRTENRGGKRAAGGRHRCLPSRGARPARSRRRACRRRQGRREAAEHRRHRHRRSGTLDDVAGGDAEPLLAADRRRHVVLRLRRDDAALLPVPSRLHDRPVRPQQRRPQELLPGPAPEAPGPRLVARTARLPDRPRRQVPQQVRGAGQAPDRRPGLGSLVHPAREAQVLRLEGIAERRRGPLRRRRSRQRHHRDLALRDAVGVAARGPEGPLLPPGRLLRALTARPVATTGTASGPRSPSPRTSTGSRACRCRGPRASTRTTSPRCRPSSATSRS